MYRGGPIELPPRLGEIAKDSLDIGGVEWAALMSALDMGSGSERSAYGNMTRYSCDAKGIRCKISA